MTKPVPDFDAEKRRRWYAFVMAFAGASSFIIMAIRFAIWDLNLEFSDAPLLVVSLAILAFWVVCFIFQYVAAYVIWYRPYATWQRAIFLGVISIFLVHVLMLGAISLTGMSQDPLGIVFVLFRALGKLHKITFGVPYFTAALVGLRFARPAPEARDSF